MVDRFLPCDANRLRRFLNEGLSEDAEAELDRHLEACEACQRKLESLAADPGWWSEARQCLRDEPPATTHPDREGKSAGEATPSSLPANVQALLGFLAPSDDPTKLGRLGPYEISAVIGSGGMAVVLKGLDASLDRYVAIKVLAPQLATSGAARQRFAREARAAAAVNHEHVVAIHSVDSAGVLPYLVMPLVRGESLQQRIERTGPLETKEILRIGMQVASGLAAAHAQGLVHRDVKPANVLLEHGVERVMITDFGLARTIDDASLTCSGVVAGTPQYMAPEQAKGDPVDHRTDLFSLGSVIYAMCTGRSPFRAETTMAVLRRICDEKPRPLREVNPEIPEWLAEIVATLHEKDPAGRFQSAAEVADLLGRHLAHLQQPLAVPMPARLRRLSGSTATARNRRTPRMIAAAILLLLAGFGAAEIAGITDAVGFFAGIFRDSRPQTAPEPSAAQQVDAPQEAPPVPEPRVTVVTPDELLWDDGLDEKLDRVDRQIEAIVADPDEAAGRNASPDPLPVVGARVEELKEQLSESWPHE